MTKPSFFNLIGLLFLFATTVNAQSVQFHQGDWASALSLASRENKLVFVDAYTTWCGPCKMMDKQTFTDAAVGEYYNQHFVNVKMDMEKGEGLTLSQQFGIQAYPTLLFVDAMGQVVHRVAGFHNPANFLALGQTAMDPNGKLQSWDVRYTEGDRSDSFLYEYAQRLFQAQDGRHAPVAREYIKSQKDWTTVKNLEFIYDFSEYVDEPMFTYLVNNRSLFEGHYGRQAVLMKIEEVLEMANFLQTPDWQVTKSLLKTVFSGDEERQLLLMKMNYFQQASLMSDYVHAALAYFKEYMIDDPDALNDAAWTFYEKVDDPAALKEALKWAQRAVKLDDNYHNNDTLAALYAKLGEKSKARKVGLHAIELAKASGQDYEMTEELLKKL
jgi:thioredoxin-related protein